MNDTLTEILEELDIFQGEDIKLMQYMLELEEVYSDLIQGMPIDNSQTNTTNKQAP